MLIFPREAELTKLNKLPCRHSSSALISIPPQWDVPSSLLWHPLLHLQQKQHVAIIPQFCTCCLNRQEASKQKLSELSWLMNSPGLFINGELISFSVFYTEVSFHETRRNLIISGIFMNLTNHFKAEASLSFDRQKHLTKRASSHKPHLLGKSG